MGLIEKLTHLIDELTRIDWGVNKVDYPVNSANYGVINKNWLITEEELELRGCMRFIELLYFKIKWS